jgi:hypothetical protein
MKGFYWGSGVVHCGFCGQRHHNITTCKLVDKVASQAMQHLDTIPSYIISQDEYKALYELKRREERKAANLKPKSKRRKPRCSYCKGTGHKRPKCDSLKEFRQLVYKANKNWKRLFVHRVNECGLGIGALIKMEGDFASNVGFHFQPNGISMVTGYNLKDLNVFCALDAYSHYQGNSTFQVLSGEHSENISIKYLSNNLKYDLLARGWWHNEPAPTVLGAMKWEPDEEWINSEWDEVMNWFFNDVREFDLISSGTMEFIENWANKV